MKQTKIRIRQETDLGTPEVIRKRAELTQGGDPALSEHPLGVLYALGYLCPGNETMSAKMYHAGLAFGGLWGKRYTRPFAQCQLAPFVPGTTGEPMDDATMIAARKKLEEIHTAMKDRQTYDALVNCVIYRRPPFRTLEKLRNALCRLLPLDLNILAD